MRFERQLGGMGGAAVWTGIVTCSSWPCFDTLRSSNKDTTIFLKGSSGIDSLALKASVEDLRMPRSSSSREGIKTGQ